MSLCKINLKSDEEPIRYTENGEKTEIVVMDAAEKQIPRFEESKTKLDDRVFWKKGGK